MISLNDRIDLFGKLFEDLQMTNSRIEKESIVNCFLNHFPELEEDWKFILETLDGKHPIGWTYRVKQLRGITHDFLSIKEVIEYLCNLVDHTDVRCNGAEYYLGWELGEFIEPIVNRTLRLGIGKSLLEKSDLTPMLAKKYEGQVLRDDVVVTEKLDGNRCIAHYEDGKWLFTSRSGKPLKVNFDMTGMPTEYIYDGEILSVEQQQLSIKRTAAIRQSEIFTMSTEDAQKMFNKTSGLINSKGYKKGLVYNIFDIITNRDAFERKSMLIDIQKEMRTDDIRILPVLYVGRDTEQINHLLDVMVVMGGEGIMLNMIGRNYEHKRTDALLKYKQVKYMDMMVMSVFEGKGKYEGMCGGIHCQIITADGKFIECDVGSGLSDAQREIWWQHPDLICNKIVQVGYHEITQDRNVAGTNYYSLRFPRLVKVRTDKNETSEY